MHCGTHFHNGKYSLPAQDPRENLVPWPSTLQKMFPIGRLLWYRLATEYKRYQVIQEFQHVPTSQIYSDVSFLAAMNFFPTKSIACGILWSEADFKRFLRQKHGGNLIRAWRQALTEGADCCNAHQVLSSAVKCCQVYMWRMDENGGSAFLTFFDILYRHGCFDTWSA